MRFFPQVTAEEHRTMAITQHLTAEDLWGIGDDGYRYDLIRGELHRMAPDGGEHGEIGVTIAALLLAHVRPRRLGAVFGADTGFILARIPDTLLAPDVAFVHADRLPPRDQRIGFLELAPDLAVEIISPSERSGDVAEKVEIYLAAGVRMVLVVEPRLKTMTVHALGQPPRILHENDDFDGGDVLPGFCVPVAEMFR